MKGAAKKLNKNAPKKKLKGMIFTDCTEIYTEEKKKRSDKDKLKSEDDNKKRTCAERQNPKDYNEKKSKEKKKLDNRN